MNGNALQNPCVQRVKKFLRSRDPKAVEAVKQANADLVAKALTPGVVHVDTTLANMSIQYSNGVYIADKLLPVIPVSHLSDRYFVYDKRSRAAYPDDALGARSSPNEINENRTTANYSCSSYGYKEYLDNLTLKNQTAPLDEMVDMIANLNEALMFRRELRVASLMTTAATYAGNTTTLGASAYWTAAGGNPIIDIQNARAALWQGRGAGKLVGFTSLDVWNVIVRSPAMLDLFKYNRPGLTNMSEVAGVFGLDEILVSDARKDTANESQAASYSRIWGNVFGVVRVATAPSLRNASFGYTFRFGEKMTDEWYDPSLGPMGGYYGRVSMTEDIRAVAPDTGFCILNPIG